MTNVQLTPYKIGDAVWKYKDDLGIVLWIREDLVVDSAWFDNGTTAVYQPIYMGKNYEEVLRVITPIAKSKERPCTVCGELTLMKDNRHFASVFCPDCWEEYKKKYSRRCPMCGQPMWRCTC